MRKRIAKPLFYEVLGRIVFKSMSFKRSFEEDFTVSDILALLEQ